MDRYAFSWKGRNVFVTGAAGFVGSWLSEELAAQGACVTALVRDVGEGDGRQRPFLDFDGIDLVTGCVEDVVRIRRILDNANADTVFHLAAVNINVGPAVSPLAIFESNIRGTWSVLEACRLTPGIERVVVASSREAVEYPGATSSAADSVLHRKRHPYQASKISAELIAQAYADTYDLPVAISRSDNVYGGRDLTWNRLIPGAVRSILRDESPILRSDGRLMRDYIHVDDMVAGYLSLAARAAGAGVRGEVFHFASGINTSALAIVLQLCEIANRPDLKPIIQKQSQSERVDQEHSTEREREFLGWTCRVGLRDGLRSTVEWYRKYFGKFQGNLYDS